MEKKHGLTNEMRTLWPRQAPLTPPRRVSRRSIFCCLSTSGHDSRSGSSQCLCYFLTHGAPCGVNGRRWRQDERDLAQTVSNWVLVMRAPPAEADQPRGRRCHHGWLQPVLGCISWKQCDEGGDEGDGDGDGGGDGNGDGNDAGNNGDSSEEEEQQDSNGGGKKRPKVQRQGDGVPLPRQGRAVIWQR